MANDSKRGFFSSMFGRKPKAEQKEAADLEMRRKLEERIQQVLAVSLEVPELLKREEPVAMAKREEEAPVELFPISASVIVPRKVPVKAQVEGTFSIAEFERPRRVAAAGR